MKNNAIKKQTGQNGYSLTELLIATFLLASVFCGWLTTGHYRPVERESLRYAATEEAAGLLDALMLTDNPAEGNYGDSESGIIHLSGNDNPVRPFSGQKIIHYRLDIVNIPPQNNETTLPGRWGRIRIYNSYEEAENAPDYPASEFKVLIAK